MLTIKINDHTMKCDYSSKKAVMARFRRSFGEGVGSIMSLSGGYIKMPLGSMHTDAEQLHGDWKTVGDELRSASRKIAYSHTNSSRYGKANQRKK